MGFLSEGLWWLLLVASGVGFSLYQQSRTWNGTGKLLIVMVTGWGTVLLVGASFQLTGWKGGLGVIVGMIPMAFLVTLPIGLFNMAFRRSQP